MTLEETGTIVDEIASELETLLTIHAKPGRTMVLALVLVEDGEGAGKVVMSGDLANEEGAEGLEFLAPELRGQGAL